MESKNIVRVVKNKDYTVINNTSLYDTKLSWKAKAIHVFMLSKPDDWTFHNSELTQWATDGDTSFDTGLKELKKYGYVKRKGVVVKTVNLNGSRWYMKFHSSMENKRTN